MKDYLRRQRRLKEVVRAVGIEPTTSRFQTGDSTSELRPEVVGRGLIGVFMICAF